MNIIEVVLGIFSLLLPLAIERLFIKQDHRKAQAMCACNVGLLALNIKISSLLISLFLIATVLWRWEWEEERTRLLVGNLNCPYSDSWVCG